MTKETMNIHKALCELKVLDSRIQKAINECQFVGVTKKVGQMVGSESVSNFKERQLSAYDSIRDLMRRRTAIKSALVKSNAVTTVTINGGTYTVAEAIELKNHGLDNHRVLRNAMTRRLMDSESSIDRTMHELDMRADAFVKDQTGSKEIRGEAILETRKSYIEMQAVELVDPIGARDEIKKLDEEINSFMTEVDSALSVSNATTEITIEY